VTNGRMARLVRMSAVALFAGAAALLPAGVAQAHSTLVLANPGANSVVQYQLTRVVLTFNENIIAVGDSVSVTDPSGAVVSQGAAEVFNAQLTEALKPLQYNGVYTVSYRIVSADGHPVSSSYQFTLNVAGLPQPTAVPTTSASASANPGATTSSGSTITIIIVVGVVVGIVVGIVAVVATRGRKGENEEDEADEEDD
jgi:copper resistance protein C